MKTTDLLTFFHPTGSTGSSWTFPLRKGDLLVAQFWVFTWGDEDLSRVSNSTAASPEEFEALYNYLRSAIQQCGGIVAYASDYNNVIKVQLHRAAAPGYAPPESMLRLRPFGDILAEKITAKVDLDIGDHLLLPVSKDSEARLNELRDNLKGLPSDLESSIINIIRRPSLEWRLERIERTLSLPSASQADQKPNRVRRDGLWERLYGYVMWKVPIGPAVVVALLLTAGVLFVDHWRRPSSQNTGESTTTTSESAGTNSDAGDADPSVADPPSAQPNVGPKDLNSSLTALFGALKNSNNEGIKKLYTAHFENRQQDAMTNPDVAWGITKLKALELGFADQNLPEFKLYDRLAWSDTEAVYRDGKNRSILNDDKSAVDLLAYTWCQQTKKPALPPTPKYKDPLSLKGTCDDVRPEEAVPGLEALTAWVNKQNEQIKVSLHK